LSILLAQAADNAPAVEAEERRGAVARTLGQLVAQLYLAYRNGKFTKPELIERLLDRGLLTQESVTRAVTQDLVISVGSPEDEPEVRFTESAISDAAKVGVVIATLLKAIKKGRVRAERLQGGHGILFSVRAGADLRIVASIEESVLTVRNIVRHA
jgi:hypothetical protein